MIARLQPKQISKLYMFSTRKSSPITKDFENFESFSLLHQSTLVRLSRNGPVRYMAGQTHLMKKIQIAMTVNNLTTTLVT